ncbi:hypothetical protein NQ314_004272 [Rhamnusium bicolor]|uniref:Uncharacterized protein n=1 Tax=Rhamnusium bicolor TaxID=1586634 RepID=A0AAV8ZJG3_9CUCU|nr:hypothetical protein NQ314_004272 [Rhamnusium bicolor]
MVCLLAQNIKLWDTLWLISLVGYYIFSFRVASLIVLIFKLPPASAAIILMEQKKSKVFNESPRICKKQCTESFKLQDT